MTHALLCCNESVDAEAETWLPTVSAPALLTPEGKQ